MGWGGSAGPGAGCWAAPPPVSGGLAQPETGTLITLESNAPCDRTQFGQPNAGALDWAAAGFRTRIEPAAGGTIGFRV